MEIRGKKINLSDIDIKIEDIAYSLSRLCRWNGHCNQWNSVAEHCVRVAWRCDDIFSGLLHDASEYLTGDIPSPIKRRCPDFQRLEWKIQKQIEKHFGVDCDTTKIKEMDLLIRAWEYQNYVIGNKVGWIIEKAEYMFLEVAWGERGVREKEALRA